MCGSRGGLVIAALRICLPKGALFDDSVAALERAGLDTSALDDAGRRLTARADDGTLYIMTRPSDVPTYVEAGAADVGIVGKDVLLEHEPDVYELCDLDFGHCHMAYATLAGDDPTPGVLARLGFAQVAVANLLCAAGIGLWMVYSHRPDTWRQWKHAAHLG